MDSSSTEEELPRRRNIKEIYDIVADQHPRYKLMRDVAIHRIERHPCTRENILKALAAIADGLREQIVDKAIACFNKAKSPDFIVKEDGEEYVLYQFEEFFVPLDEYAILRCYNYSLHAFCIDISDRGTITRFRFERTPLIVPVGWEDYLVPKANSELDDDMKAHFLLDKQHKRKKKYGNAGDRFDPNGMSFWAMRAAGAQGRK